MTVVNMCLSGLLLKISTVLQIALAITFFAVSLIDDGLYWYNAESERRKNSLQTAFGIRFSELETDGYYNNEISPSILKYSCDFETDFKERRTLMNQLTQTCPQSATDELVDIREVAVDKDLPKEERIAAFLHQIKNPYRFRCGDFVVNAAFASNGVTLEECLQGILR